MIPAAEAILFQEAFPIMPVYFYVVTGLVRPSIEGFYANKVKDGEKLIPNLQDMHPFRDVRVHRGEAR